MYKHMYMNVHCSSILEKRKRKEYAFYAVYKSLLVGGYIFVYVCVYMCVFVCVCVCLCVFVFFYKT